jgi:uncharacterized protein (DUF433 family)
MKGQIVSRDSDVMGGTAVFQGTRVPVQTFLDYLEAGDSIDEILAGFPPVTREQAMPFSNRRETGRSRLFRERSSLNDAYGDFI